MLRSRGSSLTKKTVTFDGIDLDFPQEFSKLIPKGRFQFRLIQKVDILTLQKGTSPLDIANLKDIIVQQGLVVILEQLSEHRFYDCSFGSRRGRSTHEALSFIKKKVPSGM